MFRSHFLFELTAIERSWLSAFLALDQCGADCFKVSLARLIPADQVADIFAVIGELSSSDLRLDPVVLLICKRDRFSCRTHKTTSKVGGKSYYRCKIARFYIFSTLFLISGFSHPFPFKQRRTEWRDILQTDAQHRGEVSNPNGGQVLSPFVCPVAYVCGVRSDGSCIARPWDGDRVLGQPDRKSS